METKKEHKTKCMTTEMPIDEAAHNSTGTPDLSEVMEDKTTITDHLSNLLFVQSILQVSETLSNIKLLEIEGVEDPSTLFSEALHRLYQVIDYIDQPL